MIHPLKITGTLADETRYHIYEYMLQQKKAFTVQAIADHFGIHPNVARLHLTKLNEINAITADFVKTGKGGRPGREYKANEQGIELSFPRNDLSRLVKWAVQLIEKFGQEAMETAKQISYDDGYEQMKEAIPNNTIAGMSFDDKIDLLTTSASLIGYIPQILDTQEGKKIRFSIYHCPFSNHLNSASETICLLHESYLKGQVDALFHQNEFFQIERMSNDCKNCEYNIELKQEYI